MTLASGGSSIFPLVVHQPVVRRGSISSELLMCGGGVCSILLLCIVVRCLETIDVCIWRMFIFMSVVVIVWGSVGSLLCSGRCKILYFFCLGVLKYVVCLCKGCDGCCVLCLYCESWSCRCSCMGSMSVLSCRCCMIVSCVHLVAVLNAAFCMTCSLLMLVKDARAYGRGILQSRSHDCLIGSHECLLLFTPSCCCECFYHL